MAKRQSNRNGSSVAAVAYIRMSSDRQEASPAQQKREIDKLAKRNGYRITRTYKDEGISGDEIAKRPEFCQLLEDATERGDFRAVLCWDQDRFGRFDSLRAGHVIDPLREARVKLVTVAQGEIDWNTFAGRLIYQVQQEGKFQFLRDLSRNTIRGKVNSAELGCWLHMPPLGYDRVYYENGVEVKRVPWTDSFQKPKGWTCRLSPSDDNDAVETIRWMFEAFANRDCSLRQLVTELTDRKSKTRKVGQWTRNAVRQILENPAYLGHTTFGRRSVGKYFRAVDGGDIVEVEGEQDGVAAVVVENTHEPQIDAETFARVQAKLQERFAEAKKPKRTSYLLSGILKCGCCGSALQSSPCRGTRYYRCRSKGCGGTVRADAIEPVIVDTLKRQLLSPRTLHRIRTELVKQAKARQSKDETPRLRKRIDKLKAGIDTAVNNLAVTSPENAVLLDRKITSLRKELIGADAELKAASNDKSHSTELIHAALSRLETLPETLASTDTATARGALRGIVEDVRLWFTKPRNRYRVERGELAFRAIATASGCYARRRRRLSGRV